jgi:nitronate monooxygenase
VLSGAISTGSAVLAANAMGADFAYMGTRFIASQEAHATEAYKQAIVAASASDIVYTDYFTGILGNYIKKSIENAGLDPNDLPAGDPGAFAKLSQENKDGGASKAWKDIWGAGQGVGLIDNVPTVAQIVDTLEQEYRDAKKSLLS